MSEKSIEEFGAELRRMSGQLDTLLKACNELAAARKSLVSYSAMEEQMVSVVRGLNDRWREHTDAITRFREAMDHMAETTSGMRKAFDLLYYALVDTVHCPTHGREKKDGTHVDGDWG